MHLASDSVGWNKFVFSSQCTLSAESTDLSEWPGVVNREVLVFSSFQPGESTLFEEKGKKFC